MRGSASRPFWKLGSTWCPPAILILGFGVLVFGVRPRLTSIAVYGVLGWSLLLVIVGGIGAINHWVLDTSVFHHMASAPAVHPNWEANGIMIAIGVAGALVGGYAFTKAGRAGRMIPAASCSATRLSRWERGRRTVTASPRQDLERRTDLVYLGDDVGALRKAKGHDLDVPMRARIHEEILRRMGPRAKRKTQAVTSRSEKMQQRLRRGGLTRSPCRVGERAAGRSGGARAMEPTGT